MEVTQICYVLYLNLLTSKEKLKPIIISKNNKIKTIPKIKTKKNNFIKKNASKIINNNRNNIPNQKRNITPDIKIIKKNKLINNLKEKNIINNNKEKDNINSIKEKLYMID